MKRLITLLAVAAMTSGIYAATEIQKVEYQAGDTRCQGIVAVDSAREGKLPGVLIIPEWWGQNDYVTSRAHQLADLGYVAFVADMYGEGRVTKDPKQAGQWSGEVKGDRHLMRQRANAALEQLKKNPKVRPDQVVAIGYCFGGTGVLEMARSNADVRGVVSFHGGLEKGNAPTSATIKPKVLVLNGAVDPHSSPEAVNALVKELEDANADWYMVSYGSAVHAFTNPGAGNDPSKGAAYNKLADQRSWAELQDFLNETIQVPGGHGIRGR